MKDEGVLEQKGDTMSKKIGIDISEHQGHVNFNSVKSSGVEFAIIRSSYRNSTDERFFEYIKECKRVGIHIVGTYHFLYGLNVQEVKEEAKLAVKLAKESGLPKSTIIFADFEYDTVKKAASKGVLLNRSECNKHTVAFCQTVEKLGYQTGIYTNLDYYKNMYDKDVLSKWDIWLADYTGSPDYPCRFHQYSSKGSIPGINGNVDLDYHYLESVDIQNKQKNTFSRNDVVNLVNSWVGKNEADGSYKEIIDIYNSYGGSFPRGTKMQYGWAWCAATWSALAIKLGYTKIMPIEISCYYIIEAAKKMGCWTENDGYVPKPGDAVLYDWEDSGVGDNTGVPDHIGTVTYVNESSGYMIVTEGNYNNSVKKRTISINGKFIRGFITPKYSNDYVVTESGSTSKKKKLKVVANEVIAGLWGTGKERKKALEASGYNYEKVQNKVNKILNTPKVLKESENGARTLPSVDATCSAKYFDQRISKCYITTADVYCRNDAGTNKKTLCLIPKGTTVHNYGYYSVFNGVKWFLIRFVLNGVQYTGFTCVNYLR